jgi:hypothetical protein
MSKPKRAASSITVQKLAKVIDTAEPKAEVPRESFVAPAKPVVEPAAESDEHDADHDSTEPIPFPEYTDEREEPTTISAWTEHSVEEAQPPIHVDDSIAEDVPERFELPSDEDDGDSDAFEWTVDDEPFEDTVEPELAKSWNIESDDDDEMDAPVASSTENHEDAGEERIVPIGIEPPAEGRSVWDDAIRGPRDAELDDDGLGLFADIFEGDPDDAPGDEWTGNDSHAEPVAAEPDQPAGILGAAAGWDGAGEDATDDESGSLFDSPPKGGRFN